MSIRREWHSHPKALWVEGCGHGSDSLYTLDGKLVTDWLHKGRWNIVFSPAVTHQRCHKCVTRHACCTLALYLALPLSLKFSLSLARCREFTMLPMEVLTSRSTSSHWMSSVWTHGPCDNAHIIVRYLFARLLTHSFILRVICSITPKWGHQSCHADGVMSNWLSSW